MKFAYTSSWLTLPSSATCLTNTLYKQALVLLGLPAFAGIDHLLCTLSCWYRTTDGREDHLPPIPALHLAVGLHCLPVIMGPGCS